MKVVWKPKMLMPVLFVVIAWVLAPAVQARASGGGGGSGAEPGAPISALLSLTGTLYRPGEKAMTGSHLCPLP